MLIFEFITKHLTLLASISVILQIVGTAFLSIFSFKGLRIVTHEFLRIQGHSATTVSVEEKWVILGKLGMYSLLLGILTGGLVTLAQIICNK